MQWQQSSLLQTSVGWQDLWYSYFLSCFISTHAPVLQQDFGIRLRIFWRESDNDKYKLSIPRTPWFSQNLLCSGGIPVCIATIIAVDLKQNWNLATFTINSIKLLGVGISMHPWYDRIDNISSLHCFVKYPCFMVPLMLSLSVSLRWLRNASTRICLGMSAAGMQIKVGNAIQIQITAGKISTDVRLWYQQSQIFPSLFGHASKVPQLPCHQNSCSKSFPKMKNTYLWWCPQHQQPSLFHIQYQ